MVAKSYFLLLFITSVGCKAKDLNLSGATVSANLTQKRRESDENVRKKIY